MDDPHAWIRRSQLVGDDPRPISAAVVDDCYHDAIGEPREHGERVLNEGGDVILFVQCGKEERQAAEACGHSG